MTAVKYVTRDGMMERTGMDALGYAQPKNALILIRKGLPKGVEMEVRRHESEHIKRGEEGPFLGTALAIAGGSLISGVLGDKSAKRAAGAADRAASAQRDATRMSVAEQRRQFDLTRKDTQPYRQAGEQALNSLQGMLGVGGQEYDFTASPGYQFRVGQGEQGVTNYLARQGGRLSGRGLKEMERFRQGIASDEFGNAFGRMATLAGYGPAGVNTSAQAGSAAAGNIGNAYMAGGRGQANAAMNQANAAMNQGAAWNNAIQGGMSNYFAYKQNQDLMKALQ